MPARKQAGQMVAMTHMPAVGGPCTAGSDCPQTAHKLTMLTTAGEATLRKSSSVMGELLSASCSMARHMFGGAAGTGRCNVGGRQILVSSAVGCVQTVHPGARLSRTLKRMLQEKVARLSECSWLVLSI